MYIAEMIRPDGKREYLPPMFGHGNHEHVTDIKDAARHETEEQARNYVMRYWNPPAFWGSERNHADKMRLRFKGWNLNVIEESRE